MPGNQVIYIIGFMGSGKTTAGRKLASHLGLSFIDLDNLIEEKEGHKISEIFSTHGEDYFRDIESKALRSIKHTSGIVVSTGGGTPCFSDNMEFMNKTGVTVYLKLAPGQLKSRLAGEKNQRPLLKNLDDASMLTFIKEKLAEREQYYSNATHIVDGFSIDIESLGKLIRVSL
jgi:shikimate kinase